MPTIAGEPRRDSTVAGRHGFIGAVTLLGVYAVVFGPGVLTSLRALAGVAGPLPALGWGDRVAQLEWDVFASALVIVVVLRWLPRHAPLVTRRMRLQALPPALMLAATAAYVGVAMVSGWVGDRLVATLHLASGSYSQAGHGGGSLVVSLAAAGAAGFTEEIVLVALAAAVVGQVCARAGRWQVPAVLAALVALRWLVHLYYLWGSVFVLAWVPGAYLLYRCAGSVWPLVAGHCVYDWLALTGHAYPASAAVCDDVLWTIAACGAAAAVAAGVVSLARRAGPHRPRTAARRPRPPRAARQAPG